MSKRRTRRLRRTVQGLREMKAAGERIVCLTAYDCPTARILSEAEVDLLLVGDSVGNVVLGYQSTIPVSMEEMLHHTRAVCRCADGPLVVADMPFLSYGVSTEDAIGNAGRLVKEAGADAVKLEGGERALESVRAMDRAGLSVMGHLGLTPQTATRLGGYRAQGTSSAAAVRMLEEARALEGAGVFAIVLECVPAPVAAWITARVEVPTIGIGSGPHCDGQILVLHDMLGLTERAPRFVKRYGDLKHAMLEAVGEYGHEVREGRYPGSEHGYAMPEDEEEKFRRESR